MVECRTPMPASDHTAVQTKVDIYKWYYLSILVYMTFSVLSAPELDYFLLMRDNIVMVSEICR